MPHPAFNKYRAAVEVLQKGRETLVDALADEVLAQEENLLEGGFLFNEFLEAQGTRLHFLGLLLGQLELSADTLDEANSGLPDPPLLREKAPRKRKPRAKKLAQQASSEGKPDDA